jgi:tRNA modification GTPase
MANPDAEVEVLTARERGAIAVVRIRGRDAIALADSVFRPRSGVGLGKTPRNRLRLGRVGDGLGDEVVAVVLGTEVPTVEFQSHGGTMAIALVTQALTDAGGVLIDPLLTARRGRTIELEAIEDLAHAATLGVAQVLLEQSQGALRDAVRAILQDLEARPGLALEQLAQLIGRASYGLRLLSGWRVVLAGRPNVGKSRLLNALAGYERAIVDATPGTTRDAVSVQAALGGWPVEIVDTAGLRLTGDEIEAQGVARSRREHLHADLVLVVLDRAEGLTGDDLELVEQTPNGVVVANKIDLPAAWDPDVALMESRCVHVSAQTGTGLKRLIAAIVERLVPDPPEKGTAVPFRERHVAALVEAKRLAETGRWLEARQMIDKLLR